MTEQEWLASEDPAAMLRLVSGRRSNCCGCLWVDNGDETVSLAGGQRCCRLCDNSSPLAGYSQVATARQLRLFACATWRDRRNPNARLLAAIEEAERDADGSVTSCIHDHRDVTVANPSVMQASVCAVSHATVPTTEGHTTPARTAAVMRDIVGNPFRPAKWLCKCGRAVVVREWRNWFRCCDCGEMQPCMAAGNVRRLADAVYSDCHRASGHLDSVGLAAVADALEEAGCPAEEDPPKTLHKCPHCGNPGRHCSICYGTSKVLAACGTCLDKKRIWTGMDGMKWYPCGVCPKPTPHPLLAHLRSPGPHVRGCWAIDLVIGKG
jgi:hypothetical protein